MIASAVPTGTGVRHVGHVGDIVGIEVLDHIVIGQQPSVSLAHRGVLVNRNADDALRAVELVHLDAADATSCPALRRPLEPLDTAG